MIPLTEPALLEVAGIRTTFHPADGAVAGFVRCTRRELRAVDGVSFEVRAGEMLALVGESGCGKTTTAQTVVRLLDPESGTIRFQGRDITALPQRQVRRLRRHFQLIYQDPYESLNPRYRVIDIVAEPLRIHGRERSAPRELDMVASALERVDLKPASLYMNRYPHELSGGQRQRVAIAASLIVEPELLVADEPVSMLDVSVRAGIMALLRKLCDESQLGVLMITHDLAVAGHYADRIAVMYLGRIVEIGPAAAVLQNPSHPYTVALRKAVPNRRGSDRGEILSGEAPNAMSIPSGCRFRTRCPLAHDRCLVIDPQLREVGDGRGIHQAACVLVGGESADRAVTSSR